MPTSSSSLIDARLAAEHGRILKQAPFQVALAYPSPYAVGMSSLGYQRIYRAIQEADGMSCERAFLPDEASGDTLARAPEPPVTYESKAPLSSFPSIAISVAYELELAGVIRLLSWSNIPPLREDRTDRHPLIFAGGPLTFSNPLPLAPFVDAIVMGEAETVAVEALRIAAASSDKASALSTLSRLPAVFVPSHHGDVLGRIARCDNALLPAWSPIRTPHAELSNMFLIEVERGCSRECAYCVMRRGSGAGMRIVPAETIMAAIPEDAPKVGLVGAAVSDHPDIVRIVRALGDQGKGVGLSSLRPDRMTSDFVAALKAAGYKTLTTAMDGASERLRDQVARRTQTRHLEQVAELARTHGLHRLKLYLMVGLPDETEADIHECVRFVGDLSRRIPVSLGIAPFCAKRNTPLDGKPFAGLHVVKARLDQLRRGLRGRAEVRPSSTRWAWVEYVLAQGGQPEGRAVLEAENAGGGFAAYRAAFERLGWTT